MRYVLITVGVVVGVVVIGFLLLVLNLVLASGRQKKRARARLAPVMDAIEAGGQPDPAAVRKVAADPETRNALYDAMAEAGKAALFPPEFRTRRAYAESDLVYWLCHPNELRQAPDEIQLAQIISLPSEAGPVEYYLFRFRTNPPHFANDKGWMAGVSGPYAKGTTVPAEAPGGTSSELEPYGARTPQEHVQFFHDKAVAAGALDTLKAQPTPV